MIRKQYSIRPLPREIMKRGVLARRHRRPRRQCRELTIEVSKRLPQFSMKLRTNLSSDEIMCNATVTVKVNNKIIIFPCSNKFYYIDIETRYK